MRDDGDFTAYAEARWPALVRTLVLLGRPQGEAVEVAERTLARCRLEWRVVGESVDVDVEVYTELLDQAARAGDEAGPRTDAPPPDRGEPSGAEPLLEALCEALGRLDAAGRRAVVLRHGAGLSPVQVAEVLHADPAEVEGRLAAAAVTLDAPSLVQQCR